MIKEHCFQRDLPISNGDQIGSNIGRQFSTCAYEIKKGGAKSHLTVRRGLLGLDLRLRYVVWWNSNSKDSLHTQTQSRFLRVMVALCLN